jgi:hypothetical protein
MNCPMHCGLHGPESGNTTVVVVGITHHASRIT